MSAPDPHLAVQSAMIAALLGSADVAALVANRVFDSPVGTPVYPYVTVGDGHTIAELADGDYDGAENYFDVHVWSQEGGKFNLAKQVAGAVKAALHQAELALATGQRLVGVLYQRSHHLRDPDGLTTHVVVSFIAFTEPA